MEEEKYYVEYKEPGVVCIYRRNQEGESILMQGMQLPERIARRKYLAFSNMTQQELKNAVNNKSKQKVF